MGRFVFDIESTGLVNWESVDYLKEGYPLKDSFKIHCIVAFDIDSKRLFCFYDGEDITVQDKTTGEKIPYQRFMLDDFKRLLLKADSLIGHNIIGYDLQVIKKYFGVDFSIGESSHIPDFVGDKECFIDDTLVKSKLLYPDRRGGHSLENFGKLLSFHKGDFGKQDNAWDKFTPEMLAYCIRDVELNYLVHEYLIDEWGDWDWSDAYCLEKATRELISRSEQRGFKFNKQLAEDCLIDLEQKMVEIENKVEPLLPRIDLPKSKRPTFPANPFTSSGDISSNGWKWLENHLGFEVNNEALTFKGPPKKSFKADGSLSATAIKYCQQNGVDGEESEMRKFIKDMNSKSVNLKPLPDDQYELAIKKLKAKEMPDITQPMRLANQTELKEYLITLGWEPMVWSENDMTLDSSKKKLSREKFEARVLRYVEETLESNFCKFRCEHFRCRPEDLQLKLLAHDVKRPLKALGSPKFTIDADKNLDPNLLLLGDKVSWVSDVVLWLTYRHRKNAIFSPASGAKKEDSGWLANERIGIDGRIPTPADTCGAATARFTHISVANIPRVTSIYGDKMRALFGVDEGFIQIGMDFDSLEAKVESHYCWEFDKTKEYCESLVREKPFDVHTINAQKIGIDRDSAKSAKYCLSYGGQPPTLAKTIGKSQTEAEKIFTLFWEAAKPLALVKDKYTNYWKTLGGKSFIVGVDGRKLFARSEHSIVNLLFQNCGATCAKRAAVWWDRNTRGEGLSNAQLLIAYHDEIQTEDLKSNVKFKMFDSKEEAQEWKESYEETSGKLLSDIGKRDGRFYVCYSRSGELASLSCKHASDYYKLNIDLSGGYMVGDNWAACH